MLCSTYNDGTLCVIKSFFKETVYVERSKANGHLYTEAKFAYDSDTICLSDNQGEISLLSIYTGRIKKGIKCHKEAISSFDWCNNYN